MQKALAEEKNNRFVQEFMPIAIALLEKLEIMGLKPEHEITGIEMEEVIDEKCPATHIIELEWAGEFQKMARMQQ